MEVYSDSSLPKQGWVKACFSCFRPTSKTIDYLYKEKTNNVYICRDCLKSNQDKTRTNGINLKMSIMINRYIENHTLEPYKYPSISLEPPGIYRLPRPAPPPPQIPYILDEKADLHKI